MNPDSTFDAIPAKVVLRPVQNRRDETVGGLELEIEERRLGGSQAMFLLRWDENHVARPHVAGPFLGFDGALSFHDEIKMFAILVQMIGRGTSLHVMHDPRQHVIDLG